MNNNNWKEISINTTTIVGEILSDFLIENAAKGVVLGEWDPDNVSEYTTVKAYYPEDITETDNLIEKIQKQLSTYKDAGLNIGASEIDIKLVKEDDWANSWKKYFHVIHLGKNLVIKPLWEEYAKKETDIVINFDPGMAFGTGSHPSTQLCMEEIEERLSSDSLDKNTYNILDLGTGSGVLSIEMSLMGFKNITAVDIDPVSIKASKENFAMNNLEINLFQGELKDCTDKYDFIAGNLLAEIIYSVKDGIADKLKKGGLFIGSGIVKNKEDLVLNGLEETGLTLIKKKYQEDWVLLVFQK